MLKDKIEYAISILFVALVLLFVGTYIFVVARYSSTTDVPTWARWFLQSVSSK